jgi:hypothetical protein
MYPLTYQYVHTLSEKANSILILTNFIISRGITPELLRRSPKFCIGTP